MRSESMDAAIVEVKPYCGQSSRMCPSRSLTIKACFPRARHRDKPFVFYMAKVHMAWLLKNERMSSNSSSMSLTLLCGTAQAVAISLNLQRHSSQPIGCSDRIEGQGNVAWLLLLFFPSGKASLLTSDYLRASSLYSAHHVRLKARDSAVVPAAGIRFKNTTLGYVI
ncbi:hypothetical protein BDV39DRAFT_211381 [Aspergillus sergii]|uniref:Uncharacterized protein n=1 Tax=Aspergillus sergii TaxID=1034303 RepID=A0A5N6WIS4_9EURO|nr:hypothetical protein BDV39DRAFT_211381 [Aspergillus sergii]